MPLNTRKMAGERDKGGTREDEMSKYLSSCVL
jgi:hypothetical protein